ncbi:MAG: oligosaccharide flippase family protein [Clostridia bacterium]|nr:oligosaccharide flippase family protein [Clostridia bacterium]
MRSITYRKIATNVMISIVAQIIYLCVSLVVNFVLPRYIPEEQFAHFQLYITYLSFVCILNFGIFDGLMLRYSQYEYDELEKKRMRSQFQIVLLVTTLAAVVFILVAFFAMEGSSRQLMILIGIALITKNAGLYSSDTFQLTNRINKYALQSIVQRVSYAVIVVILICCKVENFFWYCLSDICGDVLAFCVAQITNRGMYFGKGFVSPKEMVLETGRNIRSGAMLMLAVWSCTLTITAAKLVVQWCWGLSYFSNVALAFSVTNVFLNITTAVSNVLFPSLKRLKPETLPEMYGKLRQYISVIIFTVFILYYPGCWVLEHWIPSYSSSLPYLGFLLPVVVFSVKRNMLANTYLKTYRKERMMFAINIFAGAIGIIAFIIIGKVFRNINAVLIAVDITMLLSCILSEIVVNKVIKGKILKDFITDVVMSAGFILITYYLSRWWACLAYFGLLVVYFIVNYKFLIEVCKLVWHRVRSLLHRKSPQPAAESAAAESAAAESAAAESAAAESAAAEPSSEATTEATAEATDVAADTFVPAQDTAEEQDANGEQK